VVQSIDEVRRRPAFDGARVPPHNLEAEESLLGAMMLSREAIHAAIEAHIGRDDFYKPAHGYIYDAIYSLQARGEPVDPVTVAEELRRADVLESIGGKATLLRVQASTPASANATHYAQIVADHALLRRLIGVAGDITEMGYAAQDDVEETLDRAEKAVFEVAEHRVADSLKMLHPVLEQTLDQLASLYERGSHVVGVPTGYRDLDDLLLGLQPSTLNIVAARPGQGKTSFALGAALEVALVSKQPVIFFSMEMGHLELTKRLLASEARIDARKLATGQLTEAEWPKLNQAVGRLAEAPFFIDDNPHVSVMEMRAKARRVKARQNGLGLIVVDYLQLMQGSRKAESRQVEVSELSRGLKILARELEVPVMTLAQLNRQVEYRQDKRPMLADLRESGCLVASTEVALADGTTATLGALLAQRARNVEVLTVDERLRVRTGVMTHVFSSGAKPVFELRLASGRCVTASANHPFLTVEGWQQLADLHVGSRIASTRGGSIDVRRDTIPPTIWDYLERKGLLVDGLRAHDLVARLGCDVGPASVYAEGISRSLMCRIASTVDDRYLSDLAVSDVLWDEVVAIVPLGEQPVYDATVLGTHNFVANGVVVHNSIEQDADVVMFIYRDDYYNENSEQRGLAEIIVAKHRNGPTGVSKLVFLDQYTKFADPAPD
jgi:replicative DNA helicase